MSQLEPIALRSTANLQRFLYVLEIGLGLTVSIVTSVVYLPFLKIENIFLLILFKLFCFVVGLLILGEAFLGLYFSSLNRKVKEHCIYFDRDSEKIVIYPLTGGCLSINPEDYVNVTRNHFLNKFLVIHYKDMNGMVCKMVLGYSKKIKQVKDKLTKIANYSYFSTLYFD